MGVPYGAVEMRSWIIRLDCECGFHRVATVNYVQGRWLPQGNKLAGRRSDYNASTHSLAGDRSVERVWLRCPNPRCDRHYSYRSDNWNAL